MSFLFYCLQHQDFYFKTVHPYYFKYLIYHSVYTTQKMLFLTHPQTLHTIQFLSLPHKDNKKAVSLLWKPYDLLQVWWKTPPSTMLPFTTFPLHMDGGVDLEREDKGRVCLSLIFRTQNT